MATFINLAIKISLNNFLFCFDNANLYAHNLSGMSFFKKLHFHHSNRLKFRQSFQPHPTFSKNLFARTPARVKFAT